MYTFDLGPTFRVDISAWGRLDGQLAVTPRQSDLLAIVAVLNGNALVLGNVSAATNLQGIFAHGQPHTRCVFDIGTDNFYFGARWPKLERETAMGVHTQV